MFSSVSEFNRALFQAMAEEQLVRDTALFGLRGRIGAHEVLPVTLEHYMLLKVALSFLPPYRDATADQLCQFLWALNPEFSPTNRKGRQRFVRACRYFFPPRVPFLKTLRAIIKWKQRTTESIRQLDALTRQAQDYMEQELQDRPRRTPSKNPAPDYYSDAISIIGTLAREYGWSAEKILKLPMKVVFQLQNEIAEYRAAVHGMTPTICNPSDRIKDQYLVQLNAEAKKN